ncbi:hypothetical protein BDAP_000961 [Binucleata daphniae]
MKIAKETKKYDNFLYSIYKKSLLNDSDYEIRRKLIKELRKITNKNFCMNIELIGSFACGVGSRTSDIDLVVLVNNENMDKIYKKDNYTFSNLIYRTKTANLQVNKKHVIDTQTNNIKSMNNKTMYDGLNEKLEIYQQESYCDVKQDGKYLIDIFDKIWTAKEQQKENLTENDVKTREFTQKQKKYSENRLNQDNECLCHDNNDKRKLKNIRNEMVECKRINSNEQKNIQKKPCEYTKPCIKKPSKNTIQTEDKCITNNCSDTTLHEDYSKAKNNKLLTLLAGLLQGKTFAIESVFYNATFPILRLKNNENDIKIDLSINQYSAVTNTNLIKNFMKKNQILKPILVIAKKICKIFDINNAYHCTLNSYAICLLSVFFLQVVYDLPSIYDTSDVFIKKNLSLSTMLIEMFFYYGYIFDFESDVVSVRLGKIAKKTECTFKLYSVKNNTVLCIEDPVQTDFNVTRTVNDISMKKITKVFRLAHYFLMNNSSSLFANN